MNQPQYTELNTAFSMTRRVEIHIQARAETVWNLLLDADGFPRWNST